MRRSRSEREQELTADEASRFFAYDPDTGAIVWRVAKKQSRVQAGDQAGSLKSFGYRMIELNGERYMAHRLAWLLHFGRWPVNDIDHINGDGADNRLVNLREATRSQNLANQSAHRNNRSGTKGVYLSKYGTWTATIRKDRQSINLGTFPTIEQAHAAYARAANELFGEFARAA